MSETKTVWVQVDGYDREFITGCLEAGVDGIYSDEPLGEKISRLGVVTTVTPDGELVPGQDVDTIVIEGKEDEEKVIEASRKNYVVVKTANWMIIPLENLIASTQNLIAYVESSEEARLAVETLEKGVDGVLLDTRDLGEIRKTVDQLKKSTEGFELSEARITEVKQVGLGDRVCVDTCSMMQLGEGMLVGDSSSGMFLVSAEVQESEYVAARPFRVNAGGVHAYIQVPGGRTRYLSELESGDEVLIVNSKGETYPAILGRSKLEKRPMMLVRAEIETDEGDKPVSLVLQNAETINLVTPEGKPLSVVELKPGDRVLAHYETAGRHFGVKVEETISEG
jgi:3-dehydroquinate synthase II